MALIVQGPPGPQAPPAPSGKDAKDAGPPPPQFRVVRSSVDGGITRPAMCGTDEVVVSAICVAAAGNDAMCTRSDSRICDKRSLFRSPRRRRRANALNGAAGQLLRKASVVL